jgi:general secretion pathway protein I
MLKKTGFTLIEVLIALAIISIALTALLLTTAESIKGTHMLRHKALAQLVTTQGLTQIQLNLIPLEKNQETTETLMLFGTRWFWHAQSTPTQLNTIDRLEITASLNKNGPFSHPLIGFRSTP